MFNFWHWFKTKEVSSLGCSPYYLINDPSTPELAEMHELPPVTNLRYFVDKFMPKMLNMNNKELIRSINCHITIGRSLNYVQEIAQRVDRPLENWASKKPLRVMPKAGRKINACYNRRGLQFFFDVDPATKKTIYTADSADVVAHELGHAILDAIRPDFWNMQSLEIWAYHEAFSDINAIVTLLQSDLLINHVLQQTNGNLMVSNNLSRIAEQMGGVMGRGNRLRDLTEVFEYQEPEALPAKGAEAELTHECHSFGRVFSGAWYEIFALIFQRESSTGSPIEAIKRARDIAYSYLFKATRQTPATVRLFEAIAKNMLLADTLKDKIYEDILVDVFTRRKILQPTVKALSALTWADLDLDKMDLVVKRKNIMAVTQKKKKSLRLTDHFLIGLSESMPIYNNEIDVPADIYYQFDAEGVLIDEIHNDPDTLLRSAIACVQSIHNENMHGWLVDHNKLIRNFV